MDINFEIEPGSAGASVANIAEKVLQTTSSDGLKDTVDGLLAYANEGVNAAYLVEEALVSLLLAMVEGSSAMSAILEGVDEANNIITLMKLALDIVMKGSTVAANVVDICGTKPEGTAVPSVKETTKAQFASIKLKAQSTWEAAKQQAVDFYNSMIVTNCDSTTDNAVASINNILDAVEPQLDPILKSKTGYSISEVRYLVTLGILYVKMFQRVCKDAREKKEAKEEAEANNTTELSETSKAEEKAAKSALKQAEKEAKDAEKLAEEEAKEAKEKAKEEAKEEWKLSSLVNVDTWWEDAQGDYALNGILFTLNTDDPITATFNGSASDLISDSVNSTLANRMISKKKSTIEKDAKKIYNVSYKALLDEWEATYDASLAAVKLEAEAVGDEFVSIGTAVVDEANEVKDNATLAIADVSAAATKIYKDLALDFTKEEILNKLMEWLNDQSLALLNAFHILMIKDMIDGIKEKCDELSTKSISSFADFVNAVNDVFAIYEMLGITKDALGLTTEDLKALGVAAIGTVTNAANNVVNLANSLAELAEELATSTAQSAMDSASEIASNVVSTATETGQSIASSATSAATSTVDSLKETGTSAALSLANTAKSTGESTITSLTNSATSAVSSEISTIANNISLDTGISVDQLGTTVSSLANGNVSETVGYVKDAVTSTISSGSSLISSIIGNVQSGNTSGIISTVGSTISSATTTTLDLIETAKNSNITAAIQNTVSDNDEATTVLIDHDEYIKAYKLEHNWNEAVQELNLYAALQITEVIEYVSVIPQSSGFPKYVCNEGHDKYEQLDKTYICDIAEEGYTINEVISELTYKLKNSNTYLAVKTILQDAENAYVEAEEAALKLAKEENEYEGETFKMDPPEYDSNDANLLNVKLTLYFIPDNKALLEYLEKNFVANKKLVFTNATKKKIQQYLEDIWDAGNDNEFTVSGKFGKITRLYKFIVTVNTTAKKKYDERVALLAKTLVSSSATSQAKIFTENGKSIIVSNANSLLSDATDTATSTLSSMASTVTSNVTDLASSATSSVTGAASDLANQGLSSTTELLTNTMSGATGLLSSIDTDVFDFSLIEAILDGKVMMFDEVVQFLKILMPVIDLMTVLAHLYENYQTNKAKMENKADVNLALAMKDVYQKALGLKDKFDLSETNLFTVRTKELSEWCKSEFNVIPDKAGLAEISIALTVVLSSYLALHYKTKKNNDSVELSLIKRTTLYFDGYGIENGGYDDGTFNNIDNLIYNPELNEAYYDASGRSTMSSEIFRAQSKNEDPYNKKNAEPETVEDPLDVFLNDITVLTDEIEGTLALDLDNMVFCIDEQHDNIEDTTSDDSDTSVPMAIVEFGDEYTNGKLVNYVLNVKPGDNINKDTILAFVEDNGTLQPLRSTFDSGTVKATSDDDYYHVYPTSSSRHIVIENAVPGQGNDYDANDVSVMTLKFSDSGQIYTLLMNNMCYSALPIILTHRKQRTFSLVSNSITKYEDFIETYLKLIDEYSEKIQNACGSDAINATGGNPLKMKDAGNAVISLRNELINKIIALYVNYMPTIECIGDMMYSDCARLAYAVSKSDIDNFNIGDDPYYNYYVGLLTRIDLSSDNEWNNKYFDLISKIVAKRQTIENYSVLNTIAEFNSLYLSSISNVNTNPYETLNAAFAGTYPEYDDIYLYLKKLIIYTKSDTKAKNELSNLETTSDIDTWYNTLESSITSNGNNKNLYNICKQLANIYVYLKKQSTKESTNDIINTNTISIDNNQYEKAKTVFLSTWQEYIDASNTDPVSTGKQLYKSSGPWNETLKAIISDISDDLCNTLYKLIVYIVSYENNPDVIPTIDQDILEYINNRIAYDLVVEEAETIYNFWKDLSDLYINVYDVNKLIDDISTYANNLNSGKQWPTPTQLLIKSKTYQLYEFINTDIEAPEPIDDLNIDPTLAPENTTDVSIDMNDTRDINEGTLYPITSYEYWLVYFANATLYTLQPNYWVDGIDFVTPSGLEAVSLPAIYIPICKPIVINFIHLQIVFGIAIRGIWVLPIVLCLNQGNQDINALTPAQVALQQVKYYYQVGQEYIESGIPKLLNGMIEKLSNQNAELRKAYNMYGTFANIIKNIPVEDKNLIRLEFESALHDAEDEGVADSSALQKLKADHRQVITRLSKLGNGPDPM